MNSMGMKKVRNNYPAIPQAYQDFRKAGVMILMDEKKRIVLTKRPDHLRTHSGQYSFPGGKFEESDKNLMHTALRETEEEIGLSSEFIKNIIELPPSFSPLGFIIYPFIGHIRGLDLFSPNPNEVSRIIKVPLRFFVEHEPYVRYYDIKGARVRADFYHFGPHLIWGATARIITLLKNSY